MQKQISPKIVSLVFAVLVVSFLVVFYVLAWTEPLAPPPGGNVPAPINAGDIEQMKSGALRIGGVFRTDTATYLAVNSGNVGIGTTSPTAKLEVNGNIRAKNGILMAGTVNITADPADPDAGISAPIDVSSFAFSSANAYQISLTSQTPTNGAAAQHPCFAGIPDINGGCFGPLFWPAIANKTATSFRILVHDNLNADVPGLIVPVDYIVVKY